MSLGKADVIQRSNETSHSPGGGGYGENMGHWIKILKKKSPDEELKDHFETPLKPDVAETKPDITT